VLRVAEDDDAELADVEVESQALDAANDSSSLVMVRGKPSTRAMPSPVSVTRPTSSRSPAPGS